MNLTRNEGIGSIDLTNFVIADSVIIPDPGSFLFTFITSIGYDTINDRFYVNIGDYITPGYCLVTSVTGDSITSYTTGISTEAIPAFSVCDIYGKILIRYPENQNGLSLVRISIRDFSPGIYFLMITGTDRHIIYRFIKI